MDDTRRHLDSNLSDFCSSIDGPVNCSVAPDVCAAIADQTFPGARLAEHDEATDITRLPIRSVTDSSDHRSERHLGVAPISCRVIGNTIGALDVLMAEAASARAASTGSIRGPILGTSVPAALAAPCDDTTAEAFPKPAECSVHQMLRRNALDAEHTGPPPIPSAPPSEDALLVVVNRQPLLHGTPDAQAVPQSLRAPEPIPSAPPTEDTYVRAASALSPRAVEYFEPRLDKLASSGGCSFDPGASSAIADDAHSQEPGHHGPAVYDGDPQPQSPRPRCMAPKNAVVAAALTAIVLAGKFAESRQSIHPSAFA